LKKPLDLKSLKNAIERGLEERELERLEPLKERHGVGPLGTKN
jgi:hypothetical protein